MKRERIALDFPCSPKMVGALTALYSDRGFEFLHLKDLVVAKTKDEIWADAYKRFGGRVVISGDSKIAYRPHQAVAFVDNGFLSFFPSEGWNELKGHQKSAVLINYFPLIEAKVSEGAFGACWRLPNPLHKGELRFRTPALLTKLEIPRDVLERARRQAATR
ncbi:hypothetical protein ACIKT0_10965 [Hansschlegelia beijingensis]|uniref:PIN-like domain-containing protein n=1 Tax=Hansschlegelia beijingensis TaxID=1133344 RepID=UPI00387F135B